MTNLALVAMISASSFASGCKQAAPAGSGKPAASSGSPGGASPSSATPSGAPASDAPPRVTATALFDEHVAAGGMMPDLGHKYDAGVIVTGEVAKLLTDLGTTFVDLEAGGAHRIALTFADRGATVRAKGVKLHDSIVVRCRLGEMGGPAQAILGACVLE